MAIFQYVNEEHELTPVVVGGHKVVEVPRNDFGFFTALPGEEMEVYAKDRQQGPRCLVESGKVSEVAYQGKADVASPPPPCGRRLLSTLSPFGASLVSTALEAPFSTSPAGDLSA